MSWRRRNAGQTLVEFAIAITVFLFILIGTIDLGRGVYMFNGVSQAAREVARVTSVHPGGGGLGTSAETAAVVSTQGSLVPGLTVDSYDCLDIAGTTVGGTCQPGHWVRVNVSATFRATLPLLALLGPIDLESSASAEIQ